MKDPSGQELDRCAEFLPEGFKVGWTYVVLLEVDLLGVSFRVS